MSLKNWPTKKIKEVLDENYTRGVNGADYEEIRGELETELWEREQNYYDKQMAEYERQERELEKAA